VATPTARSTTTRAMGAATVVPEIGPVPRTGGATSSEPAEDGSESATDGSADDASSVVTAECSSDPPAGTGAGVIEGLVCHQFCEIHATDIRRCFRSPVAIKL